MTVFEFLHQLMLNVCEYRSGLVKGLHTSVLRLSIIHEDSCMSHQRALDCDEVDSVTGGFDELIDWNDVMTTFVFEVRDCFG